MSSIEQEVKKISLLNAIQNHAHKGLSTDEFLSQIAPLIAAVYENTFVSILLYDGSKRVMRTASIAGRRVKGIFPGFEQSIDLGIVGYVARTRKPRIANDVEGDPYYVQPYSIRIKSEVCVPIIDVRGELLGVINVESRHGHAYGESDLRSLRSVATEIASAFEERRLLAALKESEEQYRTVVEFANDAIILVNADGRLEFVNRRFVEITGYERNEALGRQFDFFIHPDDQPAMRDRFERRMKGDHVPSRHTFRLRTKNGDVRHIDYNVRVIREQRKILGVHWIARDITEEIELQRKLEETEKNYRTLFEESKDAIYVSTPAGKLIDINQAAVDFFCYGSKEELLAIENVEHLYVQRADRQSFMTMLEKQDFVKDYEIKLRRKNGEIAVGEITTQAVHGSGGAIVAYQGILRDVTKQREYEQAILESEEKYRSLVEKSLVGVYIIQDGRFKFANERLAEIFGYTVDDLIHGKLVSDLVAPEDRDKVVENIRKRLDGEMKSIRYGFRGLRKNGERLDIEVYGSSAIYLGKPSVIGTLLDQTQEKRALREVTEWRQRYDMIVASSGQVAYEYNVLNGQILWSGSVEQVLGYDLAGMGGIKQREDLIHPDDTPRARESLVAAQEALSRYDVEYRFRKKDGTYIWMHDRGFSVADGHGRIYKMLGMMQDTDRQKTLEQRVSSSELKYRLLFENANDAVILLREETVIDCNPKALEMFGCQKREFIGRTLYSFSPPRQPDGKESKEELLKELREAVSGVAKEFDWKHLKIDGTAFDAEVRLNKVHFEGEVLVQAQIRNITSQLEAQEDLARSEERYRMLVREAAEAIVVTDGEGRFIEVNEKASELVGYTVEELLSLTIADVFNLPKEEAMANYRQFYQRLLMEPNVVLSDGTVRRKDGSTFPYEINAVLLPDGALQAIVRDISDRKLAEQLSQQLLQAQKMESLGTLAGGVAHDFNNILSAILGYTALLKKQIEPSAKAFSYLDAVEKSAQRAASLSRQLLGFAQKTRGERKIISLNDIVRETIAILESSFPKSISIQTDLGRELPDIKADPNQVSQVLMNLCINARDAMTEPAGSDGTLYIQTTILHAAGQFVTSHLSAHKGSYVVLSISDSGCGMPPEVQQHLFEPFFTTKEKGKGTGLGLSVVYGIVRDHDGFVDVYSEPGNGTTFRIYLPASEQMAFSMEDRQEVLAPAKGEGEMILVVDDESMIRELVAEILVQNGYSVITASNGIEALDVYGREGDHIKLVILDMIMPEMDGAKTFEELTAIKPDVKVLLSSGFSPGDPIKDMLQKGALGFVGKPYRSEELLLKVASALIDGRKD